MKNKMPPAVTLLVRTLKILLRIFLRLMVCFLQASIKSRKEEEARQPSDMELYAGERIAGTNEYVIGNQYRGKK